MIDVSPSRRVVLLVPAQEHAGVLARESDLPVVDCELADGESTIEAVTRMLPTLGLQGPILECVIDQTAEADIGAGPRSALVELGPPPPGWKPPATWKWLPWNELVTEPSPGLEPKTFARIAEIRDGSVVPAQRAAWTRPGWFEQASSWIEESLERAGRMAPESVVQVRHCGISALLRVESLDGSTWFKASFPLFHSEASISALLSGLAPEATGKVLAADTDRGWLLLDDFGGTTGATDPQTTRESIDRLVLLQLDMNPHLDALRASGCPDRPLDGLADELAVSLGTEIASRLELSAPRVRELVGAVSEAAATIDAAGFPDVVVHGDFHPGNVAKTNDGIVLFDWSDGAIASPLVDVATWSWWFEGDRGQEDELWSVFCSAWKREFGIDATSFRRCDVDMVAGAFHTSSYVRLLAGLESSEQPAYADGLDHFFEVLTNGFTQRQGQG